MKIDKRLILLGLLFLITTMVVATQYAVTKIAYEYSIVHPSESNIRYIGSDNSSDGMRVLRVRGSNTTNLTWSGQITLAFGNWSTNMNKTYSAAFGIVNEETFPISITGIDVTSANYTYMRIWVHGNRTANAENNLTDPSTILFYNNGTHINTTNLTKWIFAAGDRNTSTMCYNISDRTNCTILTPWDNITHVRYSVNNTNAVSNISDFVWVQISIDIPEQVDIMGTHTGYIWIHFKSETH